MRNKLFDFLIFLIVGLCLGIGLYYYQEALPLEYFVREMFQDSFSHQDFLKPTWRTTMFGYLLYFFTVGLFAYSMVYGAPILLWCFTILLYMDPPEL